MRYKRVTQKYTPETYRAVIESLITKTDGCWEWGGSVTKAGYAVRNSNGMLPSALVARLMYHWYVAPLPPGPKPRESKKGTITVDHLCGPGTNSCVRPDHLEAVTHEENIRRAWEKRMAKGCVAGLHDMTLPDAWYTLPSSGQRRCRECQKAGSNRRYAARKVDLT